MNKGNVLILGARSDIAKAIAHKFAADGYSIQLAVRGMSDMESYVSDLALRHRVSVTTHEFDVLAIDRHLSFVEGLEELPVVAVCAVGLMGNQSESEENVASAIQVMRSNFEGPASIFSHLANCFEVRGSGTLVGISSVAGIRGRASNYVYGSAKAGFSAFLSGLRNRLSTKGVHVITVLPGFVNTKMTEALSLPPALTAEPVEVADAVFKATVRKKNVVYVRSIWQLIMLIISTIPEQIFKKLKI